MQTQSKGSVVSGQPPPVCVTKPLPVAELPQTPSASSSSARWGLRQGQGPTQALWLQGCQRRLVRAHL